MLGGGFLKTRTPYNLTSGIKKYADLLSLFPFNNKLVLCSVQGKDLKNKFIYSTNDDYHIAMSSYGSSITINDNETYYIVVDTYTALYAPNRLTILVPISLNEKISVGAPVAETWSRTLLTWFTLPLRIWFT